MCSSDLHTCAAAYTRTMRVQPRVCHIRIRRMRALAPCACAEVDSQLLRIADVVRVLPGQTVPCDGVVLACSPPHASLSSTAANAATATTAPAPLPGKSLPSQRAAADAASTLPLSSLAPEAKALVALVDESTLTGEALPVLKCAGDTYVSVHACVGVWARPVGGRGGRGEKSVCVFCCAVGWWGGGTTMV